jgi:hypothetical protein
MVIAQLTTGLGNNLFQYANGRAVAIRNNVTLKLDISKANIENLQGTYQLNVFNIVESIASSTEIGQIIGSNKRNVARRVYDFIQYCLPYYKRKKFVERHFHFDPNIFKIPGKVYLIGYWQSEKYFKDIEGLLRKEFTIRAAPNSTNKIMLGLINQCEAVSLHIRRGDYITNSGSNQYHGVCSLNYYRNAVQKLVQVIKNPNFFVFSDDLEWAKQNLKLEYPVTYVTQNGIERDYEDLLLMSQCKHHIIANSSFSWWGAWLNQNPNKIIIAPQKWFNDPSINTDDLIPDGWVKI